MVRKLLVWMALVPALIVLYGCGGGSTSPSSTQQAEVLFKIGFASFNRCAIDYVIVEIDGRRSGEIRRAGPAGGTGFNTNDGELRLFISAGQHRYWAYSSDERWQWGPETFLTNQPLVKVIPLSCGG